MQLKPCEHGALVLQVVGSVAPEGVHWPKAQFWFAGQSAAVQQLAGAQMERMQVCEQPSAAQSVAVVHERGSGKKLGTHTRRRHREPKPQSRSVAHPESGMGSWGTQKPARHCCPPPQSRLTVHWRVKQSWPRQICCAVQSASERHPAGRGTASETHSPERQRWP